MDTSKKFSIFVYKDVQVLLGCGQMVWMRHNKSDMASLVSIWRTAKGSNSTIVTLTVIEASA